MDCRQLLAIVAAATLCSAAWGQDRLPPATSRPGGAAVAGDAGPLLEVVEILKEEDANPILSRRGGFIHAFPITLRGPYVLVATHYEGLLHTFRRDMATGKLTHIDAFSFDDAKDMSIMDFVWANGRLYFYGAAGHETGDQDSRGLRWVEVDAATGKVTARGNVKIPIASGLVGSRDARNLYLLLGRQKKIVRYRLNDDGTPEKADEVVLKDATADVGNLVITPDGKALYAIQFPAAPDPGQPAASPILFCAEVKADGTIAYSGSTALGQVTEGLTWLDKDGRKAGWGWGVSRGFSLSPDGLHLYVHYANFPVEPPSRRIGLYTRDPNTNAVRFAEPLDPNVMGVRRPVGIVFEPDGTIGYFDDGQWLTRDPKTGRLTYGGQAKGVGEARPYLDAENGYLYGGCWAKQQLTVMRTTRRTPATRPQAPAGTQ